jgi:transposase
MPKTTTTQTPPAATPATALQTKRYDEAFKRQAVENWIRSGRSGTQIARELGLSYPTLKEWKRRYWGDATPQRADLEAENRALRAELARVREQRDILKKSLGILSEPPRNATKPLTP